MEQLINQDKFLINFVPEQWDSVTKFRKFKYIPLEDNKLFKRGISTTEEHLAKFRTLAEIANELIPKLEIDENELKKDGYTSAKYSRQLSSIVECNINELYSSLDGIRDVIYAVYSDIQGIQKKSTSKLFSKAKENMYPTNFPIELNNLLSEAYDRWFIKLRIYRTEFTHGSLGSCHKDNKTNKISYMHSGLGKNQQALIIDDFISYINDTFENVLLLQHNIFEFLYNILPLEPTILPCGIYKGKFYMRYLEPENNLTFNSGLCRSMEYSTACPLKDKCGAYTNAIKHNKALEKNI
jgi:hypothetical protein